MKIAILSVSRQGFALSKKLKESYPEAQLFTSGSWRDENSQAVVPDLKTLTGRLFTEMDLLVFVMASGIAVRMVAPYLKGKESDPAVLVTDDQGKWVIPLLSGHLGGANEMAAALAAQIDAQPVITTATDGKGLTAVDMLAIQSNCVITSLEAAKRATAALLEGERIGVYSWRPLKEPLPEGYREVSEPGQRSDGWRVVITPYVFESGEKDVWLIPRCITLGMGCRKDIGYEAVSSLAEDSLKALGIDQRALSQIASIDIKAEEPALRRLAETLNIPFVTYSAETLAGISLTFEQSEFVRKTTGVGAVSEPAGAIASKGRCLLPKRAHDGVTLSIWEDC